jgi:TPR repeat protein
MIDEFNQSWTGWVGTTLALGGITTVWIAASLGLFAASVALFQRGIAGFGRSGAALLGVIYLCVLVSAGYLTSNTFRHWILLTVAEHGVSAAYKDVGWNYMMGSGTPENIGEGLRWLKAAADAGDNDTMLEYSRLHGSNSWGVPRNPAVEEEYHQKAAESGNYTARVEREVREWARLHPDEAAALK